MQAFAGRRHCEWTLAFILVAGCGAPVVQPERPLSADELSKLVQIAANQASERELAEAHQILDSVLEREPRHAPALFLRACLFLEANDLTFADRAIASLEGVAPGHPQTKMLRSLLRLRENTPALRWSDAYFSAWREAGRPDLNAQHFIPANVEFGFDLPINSAGDSERWNNADPKLRLALALSSVPLSEAQALWLGSQLPALRDPLMAIGAINRLLESPASEAVKERVQAAAREKARELAKANPGWMQVRLMELLAGTQRETPFSAADLDELEKISKMQSYRAEPLSRLFFEVLSILEATQTPRASAAAFMAFVNAIDGPEGFTLTKRTAATIPGLDPNDRRRLGEALWAIGSARLAETTALDQLLAHMTRKAAAELLGDQLRISEVQNQLARGRAILAGSRQAAVDSWPIPSLQEDWLLSTVTDEMKHLAALAE